jgi:phospho-N-acetylmuramoyl-pentapeptide-transferase
VSSPVYQSMSALQVMTEALVLGLISFLLGMIMAPRLLTELRRRGIVKQVRADVPERHLAKSGTVTMGGLLIMIPVFLVTAAFNLVGRWSMLVPLGVILSTGILGALDDYLTLIGSRGWGLTARFKLLWQTGIAVVTAAVLHWFLGLTSVYIPFLGKFPIGPVYIPVAAFVIVAMSNAVNLTDGLDTLAGGTSAFAFGAYAIIAFLQGQDYVVAMCLTIAGALMAFLWHNAYPAQVFMGDAGSLSLGAVLAVLALMTGQWLLLPIVGIVFVLEAGSVLLQVAYFRLSGGKKLFKMSPLHHHFELQGWAETQVTMRFWIIAMAGSMAGVALALI